MRHQRRAADDTVSEDPDDADANGNNRIVLNFEEMNKAEENLGGNKTNTDLNQDPYFRM